MLTARTPLFHEAADAGVAQCAEARAAWAIPWPCLHEFFAIATHPRIYAPPTPAGRALEQIDAWLESPSLVLLTEGDSHWPTLRGLLAKARIAGPAVHDARTAALCLQHGGARAVVGRPRVRPLRGAAGRQPLAAALNPKLQSALPNNGIAPSLPAPSSPTLL
jgi:hypothetical protein